MQRPIVSIASPIKPISPVHYLPICGLIVHLLFLFFQLSQPVAMIARQFTGQPFLVFCAGSERGDPASDRSDMMFLFFSL